LPDDPETDNMRYIKKVEAPSARESTAQ